MANFNIPTELITMLHEQRVIPFLGAGFSASMKLPAWSETLEALCTELECDVSYADLSKYCNNDLLQIAEYLYLKSDRNIGPIRHQLSIALQPHGKAILSAPHVELVNLGCPQVYTTNYDECIERIYKELNQSLDVIALPKDIASSSGRKNQLVKYHGDLRYETTLVLTESSYYTRLDFESPMDLKFRSDLLGRSVLFMGYSFRDINIRIIWFKLMKMMKDVPAADRPRSFIVRFEPNPVLETLYESVGLQTVIMDPKGQAKTAEAREHLFSQFMLELSLRAFPSNRSGANQRPMFVSTALIDAVNHEANDDKKSLRPVFGSRLQGPRLSELAQAIAERVVPEFLADQIPSILYVASKKWGGACSVRTLARRP